MDVAGKPPYGLVEGGYSLDKCRVLALLFIPQGATAKDARKWLDSQIPAPNSAVLDIICTLHLEDQVLEGWRMNGVPPLDSLPGVIEDHGC